MRSNALRLCTLAVACAWRPHLTRRHVLGSAASFSAAISASAASAARAQSSEKAMLPPGVLEIPGDYDVAGESAEKSSEKRVRAITGTRFATVFGTNAEGVPTVQKANLACCGYKGEQREQLLLDFSREYGPPEYAGVFENGAIRFPDGAEWRKRPCSSPSLNDRQRATCAAALAAEMK